MSEHKVELDVRLNTDKVGKDFDDLEKQAKAGAKTVGAALDDMQESVDDMADKTEKSTKQTESAYDRLTRTIQEQQETVRKLKQEYANAVLEFGEASEEAKSLAAKIEEASTELAQNRADFQHAADAADQYDKSLEDVSDSLEEGADKASIFGDVLKGSLASAAIEKGIGLLASGVQSAVSSTMELDDSSKKLAASTGATREEMEQYSGVLADMYKNNYGESISETADAMALVRQYTGEVDPTKLQELTENAIALDDTFANMDIGETIRGVDSLMTNMGLSAEEAFDYIVVGAQNGLNKSGELTDNIAEYGQLWGQAGFSAQEMFTILQNGLDSGAYNLDKVNDFVKEFSISLADGRIEENISSFSAETQNLFAAWQNGQATTRDVFYSVINDLSQMTNQQEALTIASNTWSALGEDNAMAIITSLDDVNDTYKDVHGSMESLKDVRYDSVTNEYKKLGRTMQTDVIQPVLKKFLPVAQKGMKLLADNIDTIVPIATAAGAAIGTMWVAKKAKSLITNLKDTVKGIAGVITKIIAHTTATAADTAATTADTAAKGAQSAANVSATATQTALNVAMNACPILLLVTGIGLLVGGIASWVNSNDAATDSTARLSEEVKAMAEEAAAAEENLQSAMDTAGQTVSDAETRAAMAGQLADELAVLADKTFLTTEEQERMATLVGELNALYPEMGLQIDSVTGKLNMSSQEMQEYVENLQNMALAEAYNRAAADSYDAVVEATTKLTEAQEKEQEAKDNLAEKTEALEAAQEAERNRLEELERAEEEYRAALNRGEEDLWKYTNRISDLETGYIDLNGETVKYSDVIGDLNQDVREAEQVHEDAAEVVSDLQEEVDAATETANGYTKQANDLTMATEEATSATQNFTESQRQTAEAASNASTIEQAQAIALQGTANAAHEAATAEQAREIALNNMSAAAQASITVAGQEVEAFNNLSAVEQQRAVDVTNSVLTMQSNVQSALESQMNMFEQFDGGVQLSTEQLLSNMESQITGVQQWEQNLAILADRGINQDLLQNLAEMGPQAAGYVQTFVNMSDEEFAKANDLWSQSVNIKGMSDQWGQELTQSVGELAAGGQEAWSSLAESMGMQAENSGEYVVQGLVTGMKNAASQIQDAGEEVGDTLLKSIDTGLGVNSPSKYARISGEQTGEGLKIGVKNKKSVVNSSGAELGQSVITGIESVHLYNAGVDAGSDFGEGLNVGIQSWAGRVASTAAQTVRSAITAAKAEQNSNSPAKETIDLGHDYGEGYVIGIRDMIPASADVSADLVTSALSAADMRNSWAVAAMEEAVNSRSASLHREYSAGMSESAAVSRVRKDNDELHQLAKELGIVIANELRDNTEIVFDQREIGRMVRKVL